MNDRSNRAKSLASNGIETVTSPGARCTIDHDEDDTGICVIRRPVRTSPTRMERVTSEPRLHDHDAGSASATGRGDAAVVRRTTGPAAAVVATSGPVRGRGHTHLTTTQPHRRRT